MRRAAAALAAVLALPPAAAGTIEGQAAPLAAGGPVIDLLGNEVDLRALAVPSATPGGATLLVFWASWCQPCIKEIPVLNELHRYWGPRGLRVIGLGVGHGGGTIEGIKEAAARHGTTYPVLFDRGGSVEKAFGISALPYAALIDGEGVLRWRGNHLPADINRRIRGLIAPNGDREAK